MSPPHDISASNSGEREAAKVEDQAHMFRCWLAEGGPGHGLSQKLDEIKWFLAKLIGVLTLLAAVVPTAVVLWAHYHQPSTAQTASAPTLINQANAATKGTP